MEDVNFVSKGGAVGVLVGAMAVIVIIALVWSGKPKWKDPDEDFLSARKSQSWWSLALCFYCSGMGTWLLFATPETGATAGWVAVVGYAISNGLPFWILIWLGPKVITLMGGKGFCVSDFVQARLGSFMSVVVSLASLFFMFIFLTAELTSIADVFTILCPTYSPLAVTLPVAFITLAYTLAIGLLSSIVTDRLQGFIIAFFALLATVACFCWASPAIDFQHWDAAREATSNGGYAFVMLVISVTINELLNQGDWQRIYSARTKRDAQWGLFAGGLATVPTVFLFGMTGYLALAAKLAGIVYFPEGMEFASFFALLLHMKTGWLYVVLFLSVCLVATTVDTLQNGMASLLGNFLTSRDLSLNWARVFVFLINVPAIVLAGMRISVLKFFLVSNILSCAIVPSIFLGLSPRLATPIGASVGCILGILSIFACGWGFTRDFVEGLKWLTFPIGSYTLETMLTFIIVPVVTTISTIALSLLEIHFNPNRLVTQKLWFAKQSDLSGDVWSTSSEPTTKRADIASIDFCSKSPTESSSSSV